MRISDWSSDVCSSDLLEPDITAFGKIIGGGLPIGAIAGRREIIAVFHPSKGKPAVAHAGTFPANPLSMVAGAAAMAALTPEPFDRPAALPDLARARLRRPPPAPPPAPPLPGRRPLSPLPPHPAPPPPNPPPHPPPPPPP